jgi:anhydro-N-acetylmuramic acid kinase
MSGTSMDGIDAGLFRIDERRCSTAAASNIRYPPELRQALEHASRNPEESTVNVVGRLDHRVGECFRDAAERLIAESGVERARIRAIGSHGQTIRHEPGEACPFTLQIGDPNIIAAGTRIVTVADFRRRDIALGGQGAPLTPAFHQWLMSDEDEDRAVLNLGGIANLTVLPAKGGTVRGFDTGPANGLLDAWIRHVRGEPLDTGGRWAASGTVRREILDVLLADPYFDAPPPKSTGFEHFNLAWLGQALARVSESEPLPPEDVQSTLSALSARTVAEAVRRHAPGTRRVLVCGGGTRNGDLMRRLRQELDPATVDTTAIAGIEPDWVEAAAFAWLAKCRLDGRPGNLPSVTGASRPAVLGAIYAAD